jgi:hypothetical protein
MNKIGLFYITILILIHYEQLTNRKLVGMPTCFVCNLNHAKNSCNLILLWVTSSCGKARNIKYVGSCCP